MFVAIDSSNAVKSPQLWFWEVPLQKSISGFSDCREPSFWENNTFCSFRVVFFRPICPDGLLNWRLIRVRAPGEHEDGGRIGVEGVGYMTSFVYKTILFYLHACISTDLKC